MDSKFEYAKTMNPNQVQNTNPTLNHEGAHIPEIQTDHNSKTHCIDLGLIYHIINFIDIKNFIYIVIGGPTY